MSKKILGIYIYFSILLISGILVYLFPQFSFNFIYSLAFMLVILVIIGVVNYYLFFKPSSETNDIPFSGTLRKYNRYSLINIDDDELSVYYSGKFEEIARNGILIKTFINSGKFPPLFTRGNIENVEIFIDERLAKNITSKELDPLILHELGHADYEDDKIKRRLAHTFVLSLMILVFSICLFSILGLLIVFLYILVTIAALCIFSLGMFIILIERYEILSDKFALIHLENPENLKASMLLIRDFVNESYTSGKVIRRVSRRISKRIKRLNL